MTSRIHAAPGSGARGPSSDGPLAVARGGHNEATSSRTTLEHALHCHLADMLGVARRILRSEDLAWDAVQESLCALWTSGIRLEPSALGGWLRRTVRHRSLHLARTRRRQRYHEEACACLYCMLRRSCGVPCALEREELATAVARALERIPERYREVFELREILGLDYADIARTVGVPVGTVRSRLSRAREALRDLLEPHLAA